jgi:hypothetical protein
MDKPTFLPHLAAACAELLGDEDPKQISSSVKRQLAARADVTEMTVKRFLEGKTTPRSHQLDQMVDAVAVTAECDDWLIPWRNAVKRAETAKVEWESYLKGESPLRFGPEDESGEPDDLPRQPQRR